MSKKNETKLNDKKIEEVEDITEEVEEDLKENNTEDIPKEVKFENTNIQAEEVEKIPDYFVSPPKNNKEALFGVKNGRTYKKIDAFTGVYTDTGEGFDLRK